MPPKYTCAITGISTDGVSPDDFVAPLDAMETAPIGWTSITIRRRVANPKWNTIQSIKEAQLADLEQRLRAANVPNDIVNLQYAIAALGLDANFHALEKDTPPFRIIEETVWVADHEDALEPWNEVREALALPTIALSDWLDVEPPSADSTPSEAEAEPS